MTRLWIRYEELEFQENRFCAKTNLTKYFGPEVTGVDSMGKLDLLRSIGADQVIDRCYPLEQTAEAHRYVEKGHKREMSSSLWHMITKLARSTMTNKEKNSTPLGARPWALSSLRL